jgi:hypothetical protein
VKDLNEGDAYFKPLINANQELQISDIIQVNTALLPV